MRARAVFSSFLTACVVFCGLSMLSTEEYNTTTCTTPTISRCGFRTNTRVWRARTNSAGGPPQGSVGTVQCGFFSDTNNKDGVCWDHWVQGTNDQFSCVDGCSQLPCHPLAFDFVDCADLEALEDDRERPGYKP